MDNQWIHIKKGWSPTKEICGFKTLRIWFLTSRRIPAIDLTSELAGLTQVDFNKGLVNLAISVTICYHSVLAIACQAAIAMRCFKSKPNSLLVLSLYIPATVTIQFLSEFKFLLQPYETIAVLTSEYVMHLYTFPGSRHIASSSSWTTQINGQQDQHFHH